MAQIHDLAHIADLPTGTRAQLASLPCLYCGGQLGQVFGVGVLGCHCFALVQDIGVVFQELLFPFLEILWQLIIVLIGDHVLLHSLIALNFLQDRIRVVINHIDDHPSLRSVLPQSLPILIQLSNQIILRIFKLQTHEGHNGAISALDVLLHG